MPVCIFWRPGHLIEECYKSDGNTAINHSTYDVSSTKNMSGGGSYVHLREVYRILKVGGRAVICESFRRWLDEAGQNTLLNDLKTAGFEIIHEDGTRVTDEVADVFQYVTVRKS